MSSSPSGADAETHPEPVFPYRARQERVHQAMSEAGFDLLFLPPSADVQYLTGVPLPRPFWAGDGDIFRLVEGDACFISRNGDPLFTFCDSVWSRDVKQALSNWHCETVADEWPFWRLHDQASIIDLFGRAGDALGFDAGRLAVSDWTPVRQLELLKRAFPAAEIAPAGELVSPLRMRKEPEEVAQLERSQGSTGHALEAAMRQARVGMTVADLIEELSDQLVRHGATALSFPPDLYVVGPNVSLTYSDSQEAKLRLRLEAPCAVCVDLGGVFDGYCSDFARTAFFGKPEPAQLAALEVVRDAQRAAVAAIRPGVPAEEVDRAARRVVDQAGLGEGFWTGAGHGIGLQIHEPPALMHGTTTPLEPGMVLAVEVGIWIDGVVGAFAEDLVLVTEEGARWLSEGPQDPSVIT